MRRGSLYDILVTKMRERNLTPKEIEAFMRMVAGVQQGGSGYIPLGSVQTPDDTFIYDLTRLRGEMDDLQERGKAILSQVAVIKLNGGRSTSLGGLIPKGILAAKNGRSYLDIIAGQIHSIRKQWKMEIPLVLMNSFFTHDATVECAADFPFEPAMFVQHQAPRLFEDTLMPMNTGSDDDWAPPGHGDLFESIDRSGLLDRLLEQGRRYAFISNLDNLAACLEPSILGLIEREQIDFLLEVTDRTKIDRKGGTLVIQDGKLDLLEIAQVDPDEREEFMDIDRFRVFNTNNIWIDLRALKESLRNGSMELPLIRNRKQIGGQKILQLETAMGAAIAHFPRARGLRVGRERFFPTKKVGDLFLLQSDACILDPMDRIQRNPLRPEYLSLRPYVSFDEDFLDFPHKMSERFEDPSTISLVLAHTLQVAGPVFFESHVRIEGQVAINARASGPYRVQRGLVLKDGIYP